MLGMNLKPTGSNRYGNGGGGDNGENWLSVTSANTAMVIVANIIMSEIII